MNLAPGFPGQTSRFFLNLIYFKGNSVNLALTMPYFFVKMETCSLSVSHHWPGARGCLCGTRALLCCGEREQDIHLVDSSTTWLQHAHTGVQIPESSPHRALSSLCLSFLRHRMKVTTVAVITCARIKINGLIFPKCLLAVLLKCIVFVIGWIVATFIPPLSVCWD